MAMLAGWRFCPRCRGELSIASGKAECPACGFAFYAHSAPTVNALCEDGQGRVLLARRARDPDRGLWDLPGGFLEEGEHPLAALEREFREETGLELEPLDYLGAWIDRYGSGEEAVATLGLIWRARADGDPEPADDVEELCWFGRDELPPPEECAFETVAEILSAWKRGD